MSKLPQQESLSVEFKADPKGGLQDKAVTESVVGLANAEGGVLYIGVDNNGVVSGLQTGGSKWQDPVKVESFVAENTVPMVAVQAEILVVDGKRVTAVRVPKASGITATRDGKVLKRRLTVKKEPENIPLYPYEYSSRLSDLKRLDFTATVLPGSRYEDLDPLERIRLRRIIRENRGDSQLLELDDEDLDTALGLAVRDDSGMLRPTVCGLLLIGRKDRLQELVPTATAVFQVLNGTDVLLNDDLNLPILSCFEEMLSRFRARNTEAEINIGMSRIAIPDFSEEAFDEALVNAFCHRDYARLGRVSVRMSDEGLQITSPGGFISGVTLDNLLTVEPQGRNPRLADVLKRLGLAERTGRGVDKIYSGAILYGRPWPDYSESTSDYVRVSLLRTKADVDFYRMVTRLQNEKGGKLSLLQLLILSALQCSRRLSGEQLCEQTRFPEAKVKQQIENLIEDGVIERVGTANRPKFILSRRVYIAEGRIHAYARQIPKTDLSALVVDFVHEKGEVSRAEVSELLRLPPQRTYLLLKKMIEAGILQAIGGNRNRRYVLSAETRTKEKQNY